MINLGAFIYKGLSVGASLFQSGCLSKEIIFSLCMWFITMTVNAGDKMSFFIVADTHIGWNNPDQPSLEKQREAMHLILSSFPGIDFFIDAGDNTYPYDDTQQFDVMRKNWMSLEPNACKGIPFLYVAGNHEIMHFKDTDPEKQCALIGSLPCRPYYSITRKGIHIISLPEMSGVSFLTGELIDWLNLDLSVHKNLTTIIVTHNSIINTTGNDVPGYRGLAEQNGQLMELFKSNPQIIAWMHGHNHDYAVVQRDNMLFVSVGRLGGFSSKGKNPLGGMYVEISSSGIDVRGYNAETGKFLEGTNGNKNSLPAIGSLSKLTSFNENAKTDICYGIGRDQSGSKIPVFNHFTGGTATAYIVQEKDTILNDNPDFSLYTERKSAKGINRQLFGYGFRTQGKNGLKVSPGALFMELNGKDVVLESPDNKRSTGYYHAVPGKQYCATVELTAPKAGGTIELSLIPGSSDAEVDESNPISMKTFMLKTGRETYRIIGVMKASEKTIYSEQSSDVLPTILAQIRLSGTDSLTIHKFVISRMDKTFGDKPALKIGEKRFVARNTSECMWEVDMGKAMFRARTVIETSTGGGSSWLVSKNNPDWQVRNATVTDSEKSLSIQSVRNPWSGNEILIAPLFNTTEPFLTKTSGILSMEIFPINRGNKKLHVSIREISGSASLEIKSITKPRSVAGVISWNHSNGYVHASVKANSVMELSF
jgi:hypothetical protein